jgi:hypothetical protein
MGASIALAIIIIAATQRRRATTPRSENGEPDGSPFSILLCRPGSDADCAYVFGRRAPRERCDQLWFSSKPGGVMLPPEPDELTLLIYSCARLGASE